MQGLIAGRSFKIKNTLQLNRLGTFSGVQDFTTPFIGLRYMTNLSKRFHFALRSDIGGFGIDNVNRTWDVFAVLDYSFNPNLSLAVAWRSMGIDFSRGQGPNQFAMDTHFWDPLIGLVYRS